MEHYKAVFIVLVYRNINVLKDFFSSLALNNVKVIIVNSYFDDISLAECKSVAQLYGADFIPIQNKGYGYGNNIGCEYALNKYKFDYLIISNSDIVIDDISYLDNFKGTEAVIAPLISMLNGKSQNPNIVYNSNLRYQLYKKGILYNNKIFLFLARAMNWITRQSAIILMRLFNLNKIKIFSPHGSFIILTSSALQKLFPLFNNKMFLYNEEYYFAYKCLIYKIPVYYCKKIKIRHLEGASSQNNLVRKYTKESLLILDEWLKEMDI